VHFTVLEVRHPRDEVRGGEPYNTLSEHLVERCADGICRASVSSAASSAKASKYVPVPQAGPRKRTGRIGDAAETELLPEHPRHLADLVASDLHRSVENAKLEAVIRTIASEEVLVHIRDALSVAVLACQLWRSPVDHVTHGADAALQ